MKNFYNQKTKELEKHLDYQTYTYQLNVQETYGLNYYREVDASMADFFAALEVTDEPVLLQIVGNFELLKNTAEKDKGYYLASIINIFASHLFTGDVLSGERRLSVPENLKDLRFNEMVKRDLVNKKIIFPIFSLEVVSKDSEFTFEVI